MTLAVLIAAAIVATIEAQKSGRDRSGEEDTPVEAGGDDPIVPPRFGASEVTNLCFTGISVSSNGIAQLSLAWPTNYLFAGDIVDLFAATSLVGAAWGWVEEHELATDTETNWMEIVDTSAIAGVSRPPTMFFSASVRITPDDLRDTDGDSIPDAYEIHNDGNPYVPDYGSSFKLRVDPSEGYPTIASALAASTNYSIIELDSSFVHDVASAVPVPAHPVMICSPPGTRAVVRATGFAAFLLDAASSSRTLFKNLYVLLDARSSYQAAFILGGYLPQFPVATAATFEDIYVRAPNPGVEYFGWLLYTSAEEPVTFSRCTVNAAGSEWVYGVQDFGTAPLALDRCSFVNFPSNLTGRSCGILTRSSSSAGGGAEVSVSRTVFDESFTNAIMIGRLEEGVSNVISVADCIVPRELPPVFPLEFVSDIVITNAAFSRAGFPTPDSPSVALDMGALSPVANDPAADTDGDGFCDYVEVYEKGTDPYLVDSDLDGISDYDEDQQGTDPTNPHSFLQDMTVTVTNTASLSHAACLAWGFYKTGWEANEVVMFPYGVGSNLYVNASSNGAEYVKAFCDLDDDGVFTAATDILIATKIPTGVVANVSFRFGDVDGDGVTDEQERFEDHTDPYDGGNFKLSGVKILYSDLDYGLGITNLIEVSPFRDGWNPNNVATSFVSQTFTYNIDTIVTGGVVYVKCLRDLDGDRELDVGVEQIVVTKLTSASRGKTENAVVGDYDDDGIADTQELQDGTNPYDKNNYAVNLFGHFEGVFHTTNKLSVVLQTASEMLYGPILLTNGTTWTFSSNHVEVTGGGRPYFVFWDDADSNEVHEVSETTMPYTLSPFSHDMAFTNKLSYGLFDKDSDGMLDWWEIQYGLSPTNAADAVADLDGDGLINLYEFWCDAEPLVPDGSNTLLSVMSRSIDDRINGIDPATAVPRFIDYFVNGTNDVFVANTNFWARGLDLSCVSVWNNGNHPESQAATLITRKHVVLAQHWNNENNQYTFCDTNGLICVRSVVQRAQIYGDLLLGRLDSPLPDSFRPASVMTKNFVYNLSTGRYLPTLCLNQEKCATVLELESLDVETAGYVHYGMNSHTNVVSLQRCAVRAVTPGGNSGCPVFAVAGNELILLFAKHRGSWSEDTWSWFTGPMLSFHLEAIQGQINQWEGASASMYQLIPFDMSPYGGILTQ